MHTHTWQQAYLDDLFVGRIRVGGRWSGEHFEQERIRFVGRREQSGTAIEDGIDLLDGSNDLRSIQQIFLRRQDDIVAAVVQTSVEREMVDHRRSLFVQLEPEFGDQFANCISAVHIANDQQIAAIVDVLDNRRDTQTAAEFVHTG